MRKRLLIAGIGIIFLALFFVFTLIVRTDIFRQLDFNITVKIQNHLPAKSYYLLGLLSELARFEVITVLILIVLAVSRQWLQIILFFIIYVGSHLLELIGKLLLHQPPPPYMFYKVQNETWFPNDYIRTGNSYPSGHSLRAVFFAVILSTYVFQSKRIPYFVKLLIISGAVGFAVLIALAKVALGQHWTTDVIAGIFLGLGGSLLNISFFQLNSKHLKHHLKK